MIEFKEQNGMIFRMLEEPVPLKENDTNVLVRFITHGVIGEYVMEHWLDCNQKNVPIYIDDVDSDGDVTVWIDENRNSHHCCPFPMFEIIGTLAAEGSADWAWYQMMKGEKISRTELITQRFYDIKKGCDYCALYENDGREVVDTRRTYDEFIEYSKKCRISSWQIYKEPKPLLAEAKVDDLCQRRDGKWVQIDSISYDRPCPIMCKSDIGGMDCFGWDGKNHNALAGKKDIIFTEPLAFEGSAEWAWQMNKLLGKKVMHSHSNWITDGNITHENKNMFIAVTFNTGWQLNEPKEEPQPAKESIADCVNCKHVCTNSNIDHCHMYEPKPESQYKVGDCRIEFVKQELRNLLDKI